MKGILFSYWIKTKPPGLWFLLLVLIGCEEQSVQPTQYPDSVEGMTLMRYYKSGTRVDHYYFSAESEALKVTQISYLDECDYTVLNTELLNTTYDYNPFTGRIDLYLERDPKKDTESIHYTDLDNTEGLPPLAMNDIYIYAPNWGDSLFDFLQVYDCHSGSGTVQFDGEVKISYNSTYDYDCDIPAFINKCSGEEFLLNTIFSDSLHIVVNNAYELLDLAKEANGM